MITLLARARAVRRLVLSLVVVLTALTGAAFAQPPLPEFTKPVNDFAKVIDGDSASALDRMIRSLKDKTDDVVVVTTVETVEPYADVDSYAVKLFENRGRGIGDKGKDNGLLVVLALKERKVKIEV